MFLLGKNKVIIFALGNQTSLLTYPFGRYKDKN